MSTPPGGEQPPYDPNQPPNPPSYGGQQPPPYGQQPPSYGQQPPSYDPGQGGYGQYAPPPQGGYAQQSQDHPRATTSMILGIVGLLCCSIAAPFAWVMGKKAVEEIDTSGGRLTGRGQAQAGFVLGIIGTVLLVLGLLFLVLSIALGSFTFEAGTS